MGILEILQGKQPLMKSTCRKRNLDAIEQEFPALMNGRLITAPSTRTSREVTLSQAALHGTGLRQDSDYVKPPVNFDEVSGYGTGDENSQKDIDLHSIPGDASFIQSQGIGPLAVGQIVVVYVVPNQFNFLLTGAYMVADNGAPPGIGSGMDWVPINFPQDKQTIGGVGDVVHIEGNYIIVPEPENAGFSANQIALLRNVPQLIPAGATIRCVRTADSVANTVFGKVWGYLLPGGRAQKGNNPPPRYGPQGPQLIIR